MINEISGQKTKKKNIARVFILAHDTFGQAGLTCEVSLTYFMAIFAN